MKIISKIVVFVFIAFLATPTIVSVLDKSVDMSMFYSFSEEEKVDKEIKAVFSFDIISTAITLIPRNSSLIQSENFSKHDNVASDIVISPPEQP